jgi:hypothetical protein
LLDKNEIIPVKAEGIKGDLYCQAADKALLETVLRGEPQTPRMELLPPLDCLMWDRKLIQALFGFHYAWEIYTPAVKRRYSPYTLPLLYGDTFIGRVEAVAVRDQGQKTLDIRNIWYEDGVKPMKKMLSALEGCLKRFAKFNGVQMK